MNESNLPDETLFEQALQCRSAEERAAFLDRVCAGQPALREKLERLLEAHDRSGTFLEPAVEAPRPLLRAESAGPEERPGTLIGRYKLLQKIGEGGMGVVYMAEQTEPVVRKVALKIIKLGMDSRQVVARFEAERQALALMDHPNIAKVLDAGTTDTGRPYFVMELVHGVPITDYCDKNKLSTAKRLELFIPVCQAVQHAHQKGIIHRDLKPSNVMVTLHDGVPVPKVIDFGVAKATNQRLTEKTLFTHYAQMIGTPAYMSPEQAEMSGLDIDTRSDVYSLGVLLYELLTGSTPFEAKELLSRGYAEMQRIIAEQEPPRPSTRMSTLTEEQRTVVASQRSTEASALRKVLQGDLDWIVMKCLEKDRTRRYETSNGLAADLRRYLNNELITARPPTTGYLLKKLIKRNKLAFAVASAVAGALAIGAVVATWQAVRAMRAERLATERLQESEAITKFLTGVFQSPDPARDGRTITVVETLDRAVTNLNAELANQPLRRATLQRTLADTYFGLGLGKQALSLQEQARDYYVTHYGPEDSRTLSATADLATYCSDLGQRDKALKLDEELLQIRRRVSGPEHPETIKVLVNLAVDYNLAGRLEEALRLREEALSICRRVYGPEHARTLTAMNNLAGSKARTGKLEEALNLRREVLALSRKVHGPEHPFTLMAMQNLGSSHFDLGQFREGISICEEALSIRRRVLGPAHPETLRGMQNLGILYLQAGLTDQAINIHEEALKSTEALLGREHADSITAIHNLATSYLEAGRNSQAMKLLEEEVTLSRKVNGPEHPDTLQAVLALANGLAANGRWDEALRLQEQFLPISRRVNGPEHPDTIMCLANLANSCANLGREPEAIRLHEEALALQRKVAGTAHPETIRTMNKLASLYAGAARGQEALQLREEAVRCARTGLGPEHPLTLLAIRGLANSHGAMGRPGEAAALLEEILPRVEKARGPLHPETTETIEELANWCPSTNRLLELIPRWVAGISNQPTKMSSALKVAALQVWFGEDANYSAFSQRMLAWAAKTEDAATAEQVARLACLRAGQDASTCSAALLLARRAVELGKTNSLLPLFQLARGMAEYRSGHCAEADPLLDAARQGARSLTNSLRPTVEGTSGFYLTLSLLQQGKPDEARKHFTEAEAKMKPLPAPNVNPLRDEVNGNELLLWLAWKEAKASLGKPQATESRN